MKRSDEKKIGEYLFDKLSHSKNENEDKDIINAFVNTITNKRLLENSYGIVRELENKINEARGIIKAEIIVNERLNEKTKKIIKDYLKKRYKAQNILLDEKVDERIIGGIKIKVQDEVFDATIKSQIIKLKKILKVK